MIKPRCMKKLSCAIARQIDLVDYLASLGHHAVKTRGTDHWYFSPFRDERTPSFKVNRSMNVFYDHGTGEGGNIIDFGILYHRLPVSDFLQLLAQDYPDPALLYTSDAADDLLCVDLGGRRII